MLPPNYHVTSSSDLLSLHFVLFPHDVARRHGATPLHIACGFGSPRVAQQLINAGAALLPIRWAKIIEKPAIVQVSPMLSSHDGAHRTQPQLLLDAGAQLEQPDWSHPLPSQNTTSFPVTRFTYPCFSLTLIPISAPTRRCSLPAGQLPLQPPSRRAGSSPRAPMSTPKTLAKALKLATWKPRCMPLQKC